MAENVLLVWVQVFSGLAVILGGGYWLRGKFSGIHKRIDRLQDSVGGLGGSMVTQIQLAGVIIGALRRNQIMDNSELTKIEQLYMDNNITIIRRIIETEKITENPLTREEITQLDAYIYKAQRGEQFTRPEIQGYNVLVQKIKEDRGNIDPGVMALVGLGSLLLGIWIGSQKDVQN